MIVLAPFSNIILDLQPLRDNVVHCMRVFFLFFLSLSLFHCIVLYCIVLIYEALVKSVFMYGAECWTLRKEDERRILVAEMGWLRKIAGISRRGRC